MKKDVKKEILKYTGAAAAVLAGNAAHAQYQYTNIPDVTIDTNNGFYELDIDQDGVIDFKLTQYVDTGLLGTTNAVLIQPVGTLGNAVSGEKWSNYNYPFNLQAASVLESTSDWLGAGSTYNTGYLTFVVDGQSYPNSNWVGPVTDGYIGLKIYKSLLPHYGWARIDIGADSKSFTIKDFSVNLTVDSAIVVGSELLGEVENLLEQVKFVAKEKVVTFFKPNQIEDVRIRVMDMAGRQIAEAKMENDTFDLMLNNASSGVYVIEIESNGLLRREKILL